MFFGPSGTALPSLGPPFMALSAGPFTLFGQPAAPSVLTADPGAYTMGVQFSVSRNATLNAIWWFSPSGAAELPATIALFAVSGRSLVTSQSPSWSGAAGSGWVRAPFASPPSLTGGASYKGCITKTGTVNNFYGGTSLYWSTGPGSGGVTSGPLTAPNNAGGDGGQDTFNAAATVTYPLTSSSAANYWVDVEVQ
jgi:hypothetical protein